MHKENKLKAVVAIAVALAFMLPTAAVFANDVVLANTKVRFEPPSQTVEKAETFDASYYIEPTDYIMGANFVTISFDPTLLQANSVTEGDFFDSVGGAMMFSGGTINNTAGTIKDGYALVLAGNAVNTNGSLFVISFTAQNKLGTSALTLSGVSVKNASGVNIAVTVEDGSVTVDDFFDLTMSVDGSGTTTPAEGGPYTYVNSTVVNLTATPDLGWSFDHWTGGVANASSATTTITMDANKAVTAYFTEDEYTLDITIIGDGHVDVTPTPGPYLYGVVVTLDPVADLGWTFDSWSGPDVAEIISNQITMTKDMEITATFTEDEYTLDITIIGNGHVDVTPTPGPYVYGVDVTLDPVADPDWAFVGWSGPDFAEITANVITMTKDMEITATFKEEWIPMMTIEGDIELPTFGSTIHMADYVYFGESVSASDGIDGFDLPYPGTPPAPYVAGWFMTDFVDPYDELEKDIRLYPEVAPNDKIWDLWVETDTADTVETVDITMTWDKNILDGNEYDYVILRDYLSGVTLKDMTAFDTFTFTADHGMGYHFEIVCGWNHCPVAVDDEYDAVQDMILTVAAPGVKDNDYDDEGDPFDAVNPSDPPHGTVNYLNVDGSFEYEPDPGYYGMDSFTYEITDGVSCVDEATVTITVFRACHIDVNIGWNLISIPASEENFDKTNFFVEFPVGSDVFFTWADALTNGYILDFIYGWTGGASGVYFDEAYLDPGEGYWLWAYEDCTLIMYSDAPEDNHITTFDDGEGWYLVGAPYMYNLAKWNTWIHYAALDYSWTQASNNGYILEYLYDWDRATQNYVVSENPDFFKSGYGYWMYVYKQCSLKKA